MHPLWPMIPRRNQNNRKPRQRGTSRELHRPPQSASRRPSSLRECKMCRHMKAHPEEGAALTSKYPEDVKPPSKFRPHTHASNSRKRARSTDQRRPLPQRFWKGDVVNGIAKSPPSAHSSSTRGCHLGRGQTDDPTDNHRTATEELGHDVGAGGTTSGCSVLSSFLLSLSFALTFGLGLIARRVDWTKW